jgi:hypothetical protein
VIVIADHPGIHSSTDGQRTMVRHMGFVGGKSKKAIHTSDKGQYYFCMPPAAVRLGGLMSSASAKELKLMNVTALPAPVEDVSRTVIDLTKYGRKQSSDFLCN